MDNHFFSKINLDIISDIKELYVGYSGGPDSTALLHYLKRHSDSKLTAIHINHGISVQSKKWEQHCSDFCKQNKINIICESIKIEENKSIESEARRLRIETFKNIVPASAYLVLAHHLDDRVETLLYRLFRGTGIKGLSTFSEQTKLGTLNIIRPFIKIEKSEIFNYLNAYNLAYIEDDTNSDNLYDRNFIRNEIIPMIACRWPKASQKIAELSDFATVENILKEAYLERLLCELDVGLGIKLDDLASFKRPIRNELIRYWVKKNGYAVPNKKNIDEINKIFIDSKPSRKSTVKWSKSDNTEKPCKIFMKSNYLIIEEDYGI